MEKMRRDKKTIALFVAPAFILFVLVLLVPIVFGAGLSLFSWDGIGKAKFVGLNNFAFMFTKDATFPVALKNTIFFLVMSFFLQQLMGLSMALILTGRVKHKNFFKNIYYMPAVLSGTAVGLMWGFIFNARMGAINNLLKALGLESMVRMWLVEPNGLFPLPMWCIAFVAMWQFMGTIMLLYMAAILDIPESLFEAAYIDGASRKQAIFNITLPLLKPMLKVSTILSCIGSLKFFDLIFSMTGGGPSHLTEVIATHLYQRSFTMWQYGYGSSLAVVLVALCLIFTFIINKIIRVENYEM